MRLLVGRVAALIMGARPRERIARETEGLYGGICEEGLQISQS